MQTDLGRCVMAACGVTNNLTMVICLSDMAVMDAGPFG